MALVEENLFERVDKVQIAIDRLRSFAPKDGRPYWLAFSGGKDSQCIYELAKMAGVPFEAHYSVTSVDPPELVRFIKKNYPDVKFEHHYWPDGRVMTMWNLIASHTIPPTRQARYCCSALKEASGGKGDLVVTGVRWAESARRKQLHGVVDMRTKSKKIINEALESSETAKLNKRGGLIFMDDNAENRRMVEHCFAKRKTTVNPIVDWTDEDVWEFLNEVAKVPHCELYDEGFTRLGCIGCPLQGRKGMERDFERWPRYKQKYIKAFDQMIKNHPGEIKIADGTPAEPGGGEKQSINGQSGPVSEERETSSPLTTGTGGVFDDAEREREVRLRCPPEGRRPWPSDRWRTNGEETMFWWVEKNF